MTTQQVDGFEIRTDLTYDTEAHLWIALLDSGNATVGVDPLGLETFGTLAQIAVDEPPVQLQRGVQFGSMEAEKFVGTLLSPIAGRLVKRNQSVILDPGLVERDPYGEGWLIEVEVDGDPADLPYLVSGVAAVTEAFEKKVAAYRLEGVLAE